MFASDVMTAMIIGFLSVDSPMVRSWSFGDSGVELLEIGLDLAVVGDLAVGADLVAEKGLGGRLGGGRQRSGPR